jgi:hypothetical protein
MEQNHKNRKYLPKKKFYLTIEQLKQLDELKKQRTEVLTVDVERELKLYSPESTPLDSVRLPPLAAIGPAVMGRLPDEDYPACTKWLSSPVPGCRTQPGLDPYRALACRDKNSLIYTKHSGLIPKYDGYVPGSRFRYGGRYGYLTYNAKEIDAPASKTWGGNTSINIGSGK